MPPSPSKATRPSMSGHPTADFPSVVLHAHLYQPPREDPWTGDLPVELSAAPWRHWNDRILDECYAPLTRAAVLDGEGRIAQRIQTLEWMSWDAGPTLLDWLVDAAPRVYRAFLDADRRSRGRLGFGNALAAPYHHVILPLASRRDKVTEVRWGIRDFRRRFGREPEGMWLPETAVDRETLEVLAAEGIAFTILAPQQFADLPPGGAPGLVRLDGGRSIAVFPYDGGLSHGIAFGDLLKDAEAWVARIEEAACAPGRALLAMATDGETYGHHHRWGDLALAATLGRLADHRGVRLENFASFLARHPATHEVTLVEPSAWSCAHGVDRWARACGCGAGPEGAEGQRWRPVLREALEEVAGEVHSRFEVAASAAGLDPWALRDAWALRWRDPAAVQEAWLEARLDAGSGPEDEVPVEGAPLAQRPHPGDAGDGGGAGAGDRGAPVEIRALLDLLEAERDALRMFTSCGWFFDDIARLEPLQLLRYAARALDRLGLAGGPVETRLRQRLAEAPSRDPSKGNGKTLWDAEVRGRRADAQAGAEPDAVTPCDPAPRSTPLLDAVRHFTRMRSADAAAEVGRARSLVQRRPPDPDDPGGTELEAARALFARALERSEAPPSAPVAQVAAHLGFAPSFLAPRTRGGEGPVGFVFGIHLHQPVGNFDTVFQDHADRVYLPLLDALAERDLLPLTLHLSGPLLLWLEGARHTLLDRIGPLAHEGKIELLLSGLHEPVLPALPRGERVEQIAWMRERLETRFGVDPCGLWLTERVWEPDLVEDLAAAGVDYTLLDDRHFAVAGQPETSLHRPFVTGSGGRTLTLLPIAERLRYLVPFRPFASLETHFRRLRAEGHRLAVLADDGEKFGGWPGTHRWVWEEGWMARFLDGMERLRAEGVVELLTGADAARRVPAGGPVYLPSASYREMEGWSLPPEAALALEDALSREDARARDDARGAREDALAREDAEAAAPRGGSVLLRGGHWRNFLGRYPESARMQQKSDLLARLARERGSPETLLQALGRSRCNDPYWHGVFGGLYLAHLREAIWRALTEGEAALRKGEGLAAEEVPGPGGLGTELWVHAEAFSAMVSPRQGGAVVGWSCHRSGRNLADVLTRRWEAYHRRPPVASQEGHEGNHEANHEANHETDHEAGHVSADAGGMPSIHETEGLRGTETLPPMDPDDRALTVERVIPAGIDEGRYAEARWDAIRSWARETPTWELFPPVGPGEPLRIRFRFTGLGRLEKEVAFAPDGEIRLRYAWDPGDFPRDALFAPEFSFVPPGEEGVAVEPVCHPAPTLLYRYEIRTFSRSEQGVETAVQGSAVVPAWPVAAGAAEVRLALPR